MAFLSSGNRVAGFMPHLLGARWRLGAVLDLEACAVEVGQLRLRPRPSW